MSPPQPIRSMPSRPLPLLPTQLTLRLMPARQKNAGDSNQEQAGNSGGNDQARGATHSGNIAARTLPDLPTFEPQVAGTSAGVSWLPIQIDPSDPPLGSSAATAFNPAARLPPKLVARIESLEFVEMSELLIEAWSTSEGTPANRDQGLLVSMGVEQTFFSGRPRTHSAPSPLAWHFSA